MTAPRWYWLVRDRRAFISKLIETGDPLLAAKAVGRSMEDAFRMRDADEGFAAAWVRAVGLAWEQLESQLLAGLLGAARAAAAREAEAGAIPGAADNKLVLAALQRRPVTAARPRPVDGAAVARLRAEIAALARNGGSPQGVAPPGGRGRRAASG